MCNGACQKYKTTKTGPNRERYFGNVKRCGHCNLRIEWSGIFCPCCNYRLTGRAKNHDSWRKNTEMVRRVA